MLDEMLKPAWPRESNVGTPEGQGPMSEHTAPFQNDSIESSPFPKPDILDKH